MINHNPPRGNNRDYFTRPRQGDRFRSDYGNTKLDKTEETDLRRGTIRGFLLLVAILILGVLYAVALSTPRT